MGISASSQAKAVALDKYVNTSYDKVALVSDNMAEVLKVAAVSEGLEKYLGGFSSSPSEREDGSSLEIGDYYTNTDTGFMVFYTAENTWTALDPVGEGGGSSVAYIGEWEATSDVPVETTYLAEEGNFRSDALAAGWSMIQETHPSLPTATEEALSPDIGHDEYTEFSTSITIPSGGADVEFFYHLSTEADYDYFHIDIDGAQVLEDSGTDGYKSITVSDVAEGSRELTFRYSKDSGYDEGDDAVRVCGVVVTSATQSIYEAGNIVTINDVPYICTVSGTIVAPDTEEGTTDWFSLGGGSGSTSGVDLYDADYVAFDKATTGNFTGLTEVDGNGNAALTGRINGDGYLEFGTLVNSERGHEFGLYSPTNLSTYSQDMDNAAWTVGNGLTGVISTEDSPELVTTDYPIELTLTANLDNPTLSQQGNLNSGSRVNGMSIFVKPLIGSFFSFSATIGTDALKVDFDLSALTTDFSSSAVDVKRADIEVLANGWFRCSAVWYMGQDYGTYTLNYVDMTDANSIGDSLLAWGAFLSTDGNVRPYVKTEASSVQIKPYLSVEPSNLPEDHTSWTIITDYEMEYLGEEGDGLSIRSLYGLPINTSYSELVVGVKSGDFGFSIGSGTAVDKAATDDVWGKHRVVHTYDGTTHTLYIDGVLWHSSTSLLIKLSQWGTKDTKGINIGSDDSSAAMGGWIKQFVMVPRVLDADTVLSLGDSDTVLDLPDSTSDYIPERTALDGTEVVLLDVSGVTYKTTLADIKTFVTT